MMPSQDHSAPKLDKQHVLERNANIDRAVVAAYKRLERELKKLGVDVRPRYTLEPPLGGGRPRDHRLIGRQPHDPRSRNAVR